MVPSVVTGQLDSWTGAGSNLDEHGELVSSASVSDSVAHHSGLL